MWERLYGEVLEFASGTLKTYCTRGWCRLELLAALGECMRLYAEAFHHSSSLFVRSAEALPHRCVAAGLGQSPFSRECARLLCLFVL